MQDQEAADRLRAATRQSGNSQYGEDRLLPVLPECTRVCSTTWTGCTVLAYF